MKPTLQSEAAECGLAALAMIATFHGQATDLASLRRRFPLSLKGANLGQLIRMAQQMGFSARPLRLSLEHVQRLATPCILHWDMNHFVVLAQVRRGRVVVLDPAFGERRMTMPELSRHFTGIALELTPARAFEQRRQVPSVPVRQLTGRYAGCGASWRRSFRCRSVCRSSSFWRRSTRNG